MIEATILVLTVTDRSDLQPIHRWKPDARVNHDFEASTITPLTEVFTTVLVYDYLRRFTEVGPAKMNQEIISLVGKEQPQYVLWPAMAYEIFESTFDAIRKRGSKVIGWFFDDEVRFDDYSRWWVPHLDLCFTTDSEAPHKYRRLGGNASHFLVFSNPHVFRRLNIPKRYDLTFVGSKIADRDEMVQMFADQNFTVGTFGRGWKCGYVSLDQMVEIYNASRINLCFMKSYGQSTRPQMKCKIFDICMCGGFLLCEYIPGLEEYYELGKEIVCFNSIDDAKEKIAYYLNHEEERKRVADAGYARAIQHHTCQRRLKAVFQELEEAEMPRGHYDHFSCSVPASVRRCHGFFHFKWAIGLLRRDPFSFRWIEQLLLALSYYPINLQYPQQK